jgi:hypothetical protein
MRLKAEIPSQLSLISSAVEIKPAGLVVYPLAALGYYREWLQNTYIEGEEFSSYLQSKVSKGEIPPSVAQLAMQTIVPPRIEGPT